MKYLFRKLPSPAAKTPRWKLNVWCATLKRHIKLICSNNYTDYTLLKYVSITGIHWHIGANIASEQIFIWQIRIWIVMTHLLYSIIWSATIWVKRDFLAKSGLRSQFQFRPIFECKTFTVNSKQNSTDEQRKKRDTITKWHLWKSHEFMTRMWCDCAVLIFVHRMLNTKVGFFCCCRRRRCRQVSKNKSGSLSKTWNNANWIASKRKQKRTAN